MGGEALQCSYVVLSVGRYLDPALAVRSLNPELPLPIRSPGFFLPAQKSLRGFCALVGQFHPVGQHGVGFFQAQTLWRREQLDGDGVTPTFADFRLHLQQRVLSLFPAVAWQLIESSIQACFLPLHADITHQLKLVHPQIQPHEISLSIEPTDLEKE